MALSIFLSSVNYYNTHTVPLSNTLPLSLYATLKKK